MSVSAPVVDIPSYTALPWSIQLTHFSALEKFQREIILEAGARIPRWFSTNNELSNGNFFRNIFLHDKFVIFYWFLGWSVRLFFLIFKFKSIYVRKSEMLFDNPRFVFFPRISNRNSSQICILFFSLSWTKLSDTMLRYTGPWFWTRYVTSPLY